MIASMFKTCNMYIILFYIMKFRSITLNLIKAIKNGKQPGVMVQCFFASPDLIRMDYYR